MSIKRIKDFPDGSGSLSNDDIMLFMDSPSGSGVTKKISLSQLATVIGGGGGSSFDQDLNTTDTPTFVGVNLSNGTTLAQGTFDNSTGGQSGISLNCYVGYELNWQGGHLKSTTDGGSTAANIWCDSSLEFPGVGTSNMEVGAKGLTFPDGSIQVTSSDPMTKGPQQNPLGMARIVTISTSEFVAYVKSTTGYIGVRSWDGTFTLFGDGSDITHYITLSIPLEGSWSGPSPKEIFIWSTDSSGLSQDGDLTWINVSNSNNKVTALDISGLNALTNLYCANNLLTSLNLSGLTALTRLECNNNFLTALDISGLTALDTVFCYNNSIITRLNAKGATSLTHLRCYNNSITSLELSGTALEILLTDSNALVELDVSELTTLEQLSCNNNSLTSLNVSGLTSLGYLDCSNNSLATLNVGGLTVLGILNCSNNSITTLNVSGLTSLSNLNCSDNSITSINASGATSLSSLNCANNFIVSLDVSGFTALTTLYCSDNSLTSLRATGVALGGSSGYTYGLIYGGDISDNSLSAGALNQFYSDLASSAGFLNVANNPGTSSDNPTIATAKGYTVYGS
jgi:hypothetical protein